MLLEEENHTLCVIDQSHLITAEGNLVSAVFSGQEDAGTRWGSVRRSYVGLRYIVRCREYLHRKCEKNANISETIFRISINVSWAVGVPRAIL